MRSLGVEKYSVAGISYGGFVAFRLAAEAEEAERLLVLTSGICAAAREMREMAGREERDLSEILLPQRAEDLAALMRRSMYRLPRWLPAFLLRDFIEVSDLADLRCSLVPASFLSCRICRAELKMV